MKVLKFGGSSVANAKNIKKVISIISGSLKVENIIVVVSALGGVTDMLIKLATLSSQKDNRYKTIFRGVCTKHNQIIKELIKTKDGKRVLLKITKKYKKLEKIIQSIYFSGEISRQSLDAVVSFGELLSSYLIHEIIKSHGLNSFFVDSRRIIKTDDNFGEANVYIKNSYKLISITLKNKKLSVVGGFIGSTKKGITTTLGRGGSDYTASLIGAGAGASIIEIWTDVDGLMTADPRKFKNAKLIEEISYEEAEKMAHLGAKVIYHKTMKPARLKNIPIYIKNTFNPNAKGTKIGNKKIKLKIYEKK